MENDDIYDSITAGALRMARRRWYVIALVALLGLGAGIALEALAPAVSGTQTVRFAPIPEDRRNENESTRSTQTDAALLARRLAVAVENIDLPEGTEVSSLGEADTAVLTVTATGPDTESVTTSLAAATTLGEELAIAEATATYASDIEVLERSLESAEERTAATEQALAQARSDQLDPSTMNLLVSEQLEAAARRADLELELATAQARLGLIEETLVSIDEPTLSSSSISPVQPVMLAVLGALFAFGVMVVLQALDGRVRRRLQIERDAPSVVVLGTLARDPSADSKAEFSLGASRCFADHGIERLLVVPLVDGASAAVDGLIDLPTTVTDVPALTEGFGSEGVGVLYVAPFGRSTLDQIRSGAGAAFAAGVPHVLVALVDVPGPDLTWAAASARL